MAINLGLQIVEEILLPLKPRRFCLCQLGRLGNCIHLVTHVIFVLDRPHSLPTAPLSYGRLLQHSLPSSVKVLADVAQGFYHILGFKVNSLAVDLSLIEII